MLKRLTCPSCGAHLSPPKSALQVTCSYCGTTCSVVKPAVNDRLTAPGAPAAVYKTPRWAYALYLIPLVGLLAGVATTVYTTLGGGSFGLSGLVQWDPLIAPELRDLNGDGTRDIIGRVRTFEGGEYMVNFAAYDGRNGNQMWITASVGEFSQEVNASSRVIDDTLLAGGSRGQLRGYATATGAPLWTVELGERVTMICADPGEGAEERRAIVVTADEVARSVVLASGTFQPAPAVPEECGEPPRSPGTYGYQDDEGVRPWAVRAHEEGPEPPPGTELRHGFSTEEDNIALGIKAPGSAVPMIAVYDGDELRWSSAIPPSDPLAVATGPAELAMARDGLVVVLYGLADSDMGSRLNVRSLKDGELRWDVSVPNSGEVSSAPETLFTDGDLILVPHWTWLEVFELASGEHLYTVGRWR